MPKKNPNPPPGFDDLPVDEQIDYVQSLWDRIAASPARVAVPEWHRRIIRERLEAARELPWVVQNRRSVPPHVEAQVRLVETASRAGAGALGFAGLAPVSVVHVMSD